LQDALDSAKKESLRQLRLAAKQVNQEVGYEIIPPNLDIFAIRNKRYRLLEICYVVDLAAIEAPHQIIQHAFEEGVLIDSVPEAINDVCDEMRNT
jgi:hypothetical protein